MEEGNSVFTPINSSPITEFRISVKDGSGVRRAKSDATSLGKFIKLTRSLSRFFTQGPIFVKLFLFVKKLHAINFNYWIEIKHD